MRRLPPLAIVILVLMVIGIVWNSKPSSVILAVLVFGTVFVLWKYPPARWRRGKPGKPGKQTHSQAKRKTAAKEKRKDVPFRVIQGNKRDDDDSGKPPLYH